MITPSTESIRINGWGRAAVLALLTALGVWSCYLMAAPFVSALVWATSLAVVFLPLQRWLEKTLDSPGLAAFIAVIAIASMVVVPATFVTQRLAVQAANGARMIDEKIKSADWQPTLAAHPRLAGVLNEVEKDFNLSGTIQSVTSSLSSTAGSVVHGTVYQLITFLLVFYLLFFLLRDRHAALGVIRALSPLTEEQMDRMIFRVSETIRATLYGTLLVSAVQGLLGGLMFWWLGIPGALLWGVVMALLAVVPVLGAFVVWLPAVGVLGLQGHWGEALILGLWGMLVVGTADNLLRPMLVGKRLHLHTVLAFISVVGGLLAFGAAGLVLGPALLTITCVLLDTWLRSERTKEADHSDRDALESLETDGGPPLPETGGAAA
jgi:predicted PurR-regulated permease PerM